MDPQTKNWWFKEIIAPDILPHNGYHYFLQHKLGKVFQSHMKREETEVLDGLAKTVIH